MRLTRIDMFGAVPGRGSALDVLLPTGADGSTEQDAREAAAHARTTDDTIESVLVGDWSRPDRTFTSRIFNTAGETPFGTHSTAGTAALLVAAGHLDPGEVGRVTEDGCLWSWTDGRTVEVPFAGPVVDDEAPAAPAVFRPYGAAPRARGIGRAFTVLPVGVDPRTLPAPDVAGMDAAGLTDLTLYRWDPERHEVLARVFAPGFGIPEDPGCLPAAAALGLAGLELAGAGATVTVRQVTRRGGESVLRVAGSVDGGTARVRVTAPVWTPADIGDISGPARARATHGTGAPGATTRPRTHRSRPSGGASTA